MGVFIKPLFVLPRNVTKSRFMHMADQQYPTHFHPEIFEAEEEAINSFNAKNGPPKVLIIETSCAMMETSTRR
jgi:hypothetical protein